jgi:hypothetical protein
VTHRDTRRHLPPIAFLCSDFGRHGPTRNDRRSERGCSKAVARRALLCSKCGWYRSGVANLSELRHFTATYLIPELNLPPRQAAQQLGHSDACKLILSLYAHPDEDRMRDDIREAFERNVA